MEKLAIQFLAIVLSIHSVLFLYFVIQAKNNLKRAKKILHDTIEYKGKIKNSSTSKESVDLFGKSINKKSLGKCYRCKDRDAIWETNWDGNFCNTCFDYRAGLE
jgi:hypothetical protein